MQTQTCAPLSLVGEISISGSMRAMDCHIQTAVETGYNRMFGAGGAFGYVLTAMLTIYVALIAYGFMTGRTRLTLTMMSPRVITMVLVLSFLSVYPAYHAVFYGLLMNGPDEVTAVLLGQKGASAVYHFADALDGLFIKFAEIAKSMDASGQNGMGVLDSKSMPVTLFWLSGLMLMFSTLGVLILSRMVLYLLLIIGPIFILLGLFSQTRGLFNGWIRTALIFAMVPMLTVLGGTAALMLFVPLIEAIAYDPMLAVKQVQPMIILFMGSIIYAAFMLVLVWVAASLVRDWQAALRKDTPPDRGDSSVQTLLQPAGAIGAGPMAYATHAAQGGGFERTEPLVAAITRETHSNSNRSDLAQWQGATTSTATGQGSRVEGLGQRFRSKPQTSQRSDMK